MDNEHGDEKYSDIIRSWGFKEWFGIIFFLAVVASYFLFPMKKEGDSTIQKKIEAKEISLFTESDVLLMNKSINSMPENINFSVYSNEVNPYKGNSFNLSLRNGWMVLGSGDDRKQGQIKRFSNPDFNCLGFIEPVRFSQLMYSSPNAKEKFILCRSLDNLEVISKTHSGSRPAHEKIPFSIKKGELFFKKELLDAPSMSNVAPLYLKVKLSE